MEQPLDERSLRTHVELPAHPGTTTSATSGAELLIDVEIKDFAGTWTYTGPAANARRARHITGCPVFSLTLQRINEMTLDGAFANGRPAKLVRQ